MADNVPRNVEREVSSAAGSLIDVKEIKVLDEQEEGTVYGIVVNDPEAAEGENPRIDVFRPDNDSMGVFGDRLHRAMQQVRKQVLGIEDETDQKLAETRKELEESGHDTSEVEYGPGPKPDLSTVQDSGYDDGDIRVQSTSEIDLPEDMTAADDATEGTVAEETTSEPEPRQTETDGGDQQMTEESINTDDVWGRIADTALDGREMEDKGHEVAAEALMSEIKEEIDGYLEDEDDA